MISIILMFWIAFNVVYFFDIKVTRYQQKQYLKNTKPVARKAHDFPRCAFFNIEKWWHWALLSPVVFAAFSIFLVKVLIISTIEAVKAFSITFVKALQ